MKKIIKINESGKKIESLILDFYTAAHPYAFSVVPDLSNAAEIYHTNPKLFFIPKHESLGEYNEEYGDELYMIEDDEFVQKMHMVNKLYYIKYFN